MDSSDFSSRNLTDQEETSKLESHEVEPEWTDEKHWSFLKSMESTFVNHLYTSIEMFGLQSQQSTASRSRSSKQKQTSTRPSGQFKVQRNGFWSKVDLQNDESEYHQREESKAPLSNPWIQHYRNSKVQNKRRSASSARTPSTVYTSSLPPSCEDTNGSNLEVTDQNFNDGALEEEKSTAKRENSKTNRSNDQVVPNGKAIRSDRSVEGHVQKHPKA